MWLWHLTKESAAAQNAAFLLPPRGQIHSLSCLFYRSQTHESHRLIALFCMPKIITRLPGPALARESHSLAHPDPPSPPVSANQRLWKSGTMSDWDGLFDDSSEQDSSLHGASSASGMGSSHSLQNDPSHTSGGRGTPIAADPFGTNLRSYAAQNAFHASSAALTKSTGSERISHTACDGSVLGVSPRFSGPREPGNTVSSVSSLNDPILEHFASHTSSASPTTSAIRPNGGLGTPSSSFFEATDSDETDSYNEELNHRQGYAVGTPATSDASVEADTITALDQDHEDQATATLNRNSLLAGLESPSE